MSEVPIAVWEFEPGSGLTRWNQALRDLLGITATDAREATSQLEAERRERERLIVAERSAREAATAIEAELVHQRTYDASTGAPTRDELLRRLDRPGASPTAQRFLIALGLDGFRLMRGQELSEALLRGEAARIRLVEGGQPFRVDEDRFALVVEDERRGAGSAREDPRGAGVTPRKAPAPAAHDHPDRARRPLTRPASTDAPGVH